MATDIERALVACKEANDLSMFLRLLSRADLFAHVDKRRVDKAIKRNRLDDALHHRHWENLRATTPHDLTIFTRGALPQRVDAVVACGVVPDSLWGGPGRKRDLVINPGTPSEFRIADANSIGPFLAKVRDAEPAPSGCSDQLITHDDATLDAELLHALACGGHLAVHGRQPWNEVGDIYSCYIDDVTGLGESWDVKDNASWTVQLARLLAGSNTDPDLENLFEARRRLAAFDPEGARTPGVWFAYADQMTPHDSGWIAHVVSDIAEYEERMIDDGVLSPGEFVPSILAYDFGRAVPFSRWGLGARLASFAEAEDGIRIAGRNARAVYDSWRMFSAGYILGRALRFGDDDHMYTSAVGPHHLLVNTPESPWRSVDFADPTRV